MTVRGLSSRKTVLLLRHMARGIVEEGESKTVVNMYLDNTWRWVATHLERAAEIKDRITAVRDHDFEVIKEFLALDRILRPAAVLAIRDLGFPNQGPVTRSSAA
ncbi:hypothetical protein ADL19_05550 [Streptomyces purpurogeneiscleroticus]|nr:hypothetical protein ADL19_05550 [Streptomyces purpurogeneiscleroticus]